MNEIKRTKLTRRQQQLLSAMSKAPDKSDQDILSGPGLTLLQVGRWLDEEHFVTAMESMLAGAQAVTEILRARSMHAAWRKMTELCGSDEPEIGRKASMDVLGLKWDGSPIAPPKPPSPEAEFSMKPETASKILQILADEKDDAA